MPTARRKPHSTTFTRANRSAGGEIGLELPLDAACQTLTWRRQSEWDVYPDDQIGRPQGTAKARRVSEAVGNALRGVPNGGPSWRVYPAMPEETRYRKHPKSPWPWTSDLELSEAKTWPWSLDMNDGSGTRDFASTKFHVFEARLCDAEGRGVAVFSDGRANVRAGLSKAAVLLHLWQPGEAREVPRARDWKAASRSLSPRRRRRNIRTFVLAITGFPPSLLLQSAPGTRRFPRLLSRPRG